MRYTFDCVAIASEENKTMMMVSWVGIARMISSYFFVLLLLLFLLSNNQQKIENETQFNDKMACFLETACVFLLLLIYRTNVCVCVWNKHVHLLGISDEKKNRLKLYYYWTYMQLQLWPLDSLLCRAVTMHGIRIWTAIYRNTRKLNLSKLSPSLPAIVHRCVDRHVNRVSMAVVDYFRYI